MSKAAEMIANAILQERIEIKIGADSYNIGKPSVATVIEVSKYISRLPILPLLKAEDESKTKELELQYVLAHAKDWTIVSEISAILLLGKKNMITTKKLFDLIPYKRIDNVKRLAPVLLDEFSCEELSRITAEAIGSQKVGFFLDIIITLNEANLLKRTKGATIVSGQ